MTSMRWRLQTLLGSVVLAGLVLATIVGAGSAGLQALDAPVLGVGTPAQPSSPFGVVGTVVLPGSEPPLGTPGAGGVIPDDEVDADAAEGLIPAVGRLLDRVTGAGSSDAAAAAQEQPKDEPGATTRTAEAEVPADRPADRSAVEDPDAEVAAAPAARPGASA